MDEPLPVPRHRGEVMRNIVVDQARRRNAGKRGSGLERVTATGIPVD
jgi:hypothetical protein